MTYDINIEQIKSLLSRFYEGQTSPEEERQLAAFFHRGDVPEDLQQDKQLFLLLAQTSEQEMSQDIADEITAFVNNLGHNNRVQFIPTPKLRQSVNLHMKTPPKLWYHAAATITLLLALGGGIWHYQTTIAPFRDTCTTPEEAAAQIQRANSMIAKATEQCMAPTSKALQKTDAAKQLINQYINF